MADGFEGGETDRSRATGLEHAEVLRRDTHGIGQIVQAPLPLRQHNIEVDDNRHVFLRMALLELHGEGLLLLKFFAFFHDPGQQQNQHPTEEIAIDRENEGEALGLQQELQ